MPGIASLQPYNLNFPKLIFPDLSDVFAQVNAAYRSDRTGENIGQGIAAAGSAIGGAVASIPKNQAALKAAATEEQLAQAKILESQAATKLLDAAPPGNLQVVGGQRSLIIPRAPAVTRGMLSPGASSLVDPNAPDFDENELIEKFDGTSTVPDPGTPSDLFGTPSTEDPLATPDLTKPLAGVSSELTVPGDLRPGVRLTGRASRGIPSNGIPAVEPELPTSTPVVAPAAVAAGPLAPVPMPNRATDSSKFPEIDPTSDFLKSLPLRPELLPAAMKDAEVAPLAPQIEAKAGLLAPAAPSAADPAATAKPQPIQLPSGQRRMKDGNVAILDNGVVTHVINPTTGAKIATGKNPPTGPVFKSAEDLKAAGYDAKTAVPLAGGRFEAKHLAVPDKETPTENALNRAIIQRGKNPVGMSLEEKENYLKNEVPLKPSEKLSYIRDLRKGYEELPSTTVLFGKGQMPGLDQITEKLEEIKKTAGDDFSKMTPQQGRTLVFQFSKFNDPNSAVLLSEYKAAADTLSIPDKFWQIVNKASTGESVTPAQAQDIYSTIKAAYERAKGNYATDTSDIIEEAKALGVTPRRLGIPGRGEAWATEKATAETPAATAAAAPAPAAATGDGKSPATAVQMTSQEQYDKFPSGDWYIDSTGKPKRKK